MRKSTTGILEQGILMRVLIVGLDTFARKNKLQIKLGSERNYSFDVLCNDRRGESEREFEAFKKNGSKLFCTSNGNLRKVLLFLYLLFKNNYHHVELYPGGRLGFFYSIVLWLSRSRFLVIERGDIGCIKDYGRLVRFSLITAYKLSAGVIYKETYMKDLLVSFGAKNLYFLPNCVELVDSQFLHSGNERSDFLWVNRIIKQRKANWLVRSFKSHELSGFRLDVVGFKDLSEDVSSMSPLELELSRIKSESTRFYALQEPFRFYQKSRFFCLPSEIVFGNNSLLEAMSYGLVPIVTRSPGIELIIRDGENGIVTELTEKDYFAGLVRASLMAPDEVERMSNAAMMTVKESFSVGQWIDKLETIYRQQ